LTNGNIYDIIGVEGEISIYCYELVLHEQERSINMSLRKSNIPKIINNIIFLKGGGA
jgi:hypothetical protein